MKVSVYNQEGKTVGEVELSAKLFEVKPNEHLMAESVRVQQSNARLGLAHTKTRGEVRGGGKKPWKQKGTGRARAGSIRSPLWRKGGVTFGPRSNRNWELKINKKAKTKALAMALSDKAAHGKVIVVDAITMPEVKTRTFTTILKSLQTSVKDLGKKTLILVPTGKSGVVRASRNIPTCTPMPAKTLNIVSVVNADWLLVLKDSLPVLEQTFTAKTVEKGE
jgi:large subunit ribosomal protein L4